jgi:hypothetical protein
MVGRATESIVYVNKIKCMSLLDSGSMVSTISVATLKSMHPPPDIKTLDEFRLSVKVASVTAVSRTTFDLHIPDTVKTDIGPTLIGLLFVDFTKLTPASKAEKLYPNYGVL